MIALVSEVGGFNLHTPIHPSYFCNDKNVIAIIYFKKIYYAHAINNKISPSQIKIFDTMFYHFTAKFKFLSKRIVLYVTKLIGEEM